MSVINPVSIKAGTTIIGLGKKLLGGNPEFIKKYFEDSSGNYEKRFTDSRFFRWNVLPYPSKNLPGWCTSPDGQAELNSIVAGGGGGDVYIKLFHYDKGDINHPTVLQWIKDGYMGFKDNPPNSQRITKFKVLNDTMIYIGGAGDPISLDSVNNRNLNNTNTGNFQSATGIDLSKPKLMTPLNIGMFALLAVVIGVSIMKGKQ